MSQRIACVRIPSSPTGGCPPGPEPRAALAAALLAAAPRVTPAREHPCAFWADAAGMDRLGGDAAVARGLLRAAAAAGFPHARVGIAGCCIAAAAATRVAGSPWRVVPPGADADFLAHRSLAVLPLARPLREALALLGLRTLGCLAALSPADVELRLGAEGLAAWRLARGMDRRWPFRPPAPGAVVAELELDAPVMAAEVLRFVLPGLVAAVVDRLAERQRLPARLVLTLRTDGAGDLVRDVRPARPTADARVLADLCRRAAEETPWPAPVAAVALAAAEAGTARADQLDIFQAPAPDPGALHAALLPGFARWGDGALSAPAWNGAHLPAEAAAWEARGPAALAAFADAPPPPEGAEPDAPRLGRGALPLCLRRPAEPRALRVREDAARRPVEVDLQVPVTAAVGGTEPGFPRRAWKSRAEGPERVSGAWWAGGEAREYWRVESPEGWLGLVFRDAATGNWFLEGWFD